MIRKSGQSVYADLFSDGTLRVTIIDNIDLTENSILFNSQPDFLFDVDNVISESDQLKLGNINKDACLLSSVSRTKSTIYDIVHCMNVEWFGTLTINPNYECINRNDKNCVKKYCGKWFNNIKQRYAPNLQYLAIPEPHLKGGWHLHVLLGNTGNLEFRWSGIKQKGRCVYNLVQWHAGFTNFTKVDNRQACGNYVTKYITKTFLESESLKDSFGKQRYLVSKNIPKKTQPVKFFRELDESHFFKINKSDHNKNLADSVALDLGVFEFTFSKNLDLDRGDFSFHSQRFFYKLKTND